MFLAMLLPSKAVLAAPSCLVDPEPGRDTRIRIKDKEPDQPLSEKTPLPDCSQLKLVRGMIHVMYEQNGDLKHKVCKSANDPCSLDASTWPSWLDIFKSQSRPGGKRMDEDVSRLPGIPYGRVFSIEKAATFDFSKAGLTHWNLTLTEAGGKKPIYSKSGSDPVVQIPTNLLRLGGKYTLLIDGTKKYKGGFDILGSAEAEDITKQIRQVQNDPGTTVRGKKLDELVILYDNNLDYEVELLRRDLNL
jgi:hypothetical protein